MIISIGGICCVAHHLREKNITLESYPFDWIKIGVGDLIALFKNNFKDFLDKKYFYPIKTSNKHFVDYKGDSIITGHKKYLSIRFCHDFSTASSIDSQIDNVIVKYDRRIKRLIHALTTNKSITLVRYQTKNISENSLLTLKNIIEEKYDIKVNLKVICYFPKDLPKKLDYWIDNKIMDDWKVNHIPWDEILV